VPYLCKDKWDICTGTTDFRRTQLILYFFIIFWKTKWNWISLEYIGAWWAIILSSIVNCLVSENDGLNQHCRSNCRFVLIILLLTLLHNSCVIYVSDVSVVFIVYLSHLLFIYYLKLIILNVKKLLKRFNEEQIKG